MDKIVDYGTLKLAVATYLHRTDQADNAPVFIALGVSKINRECYSVHQEQVASLSVAAAESLVALPAQFKEMRSLTCDGAPLRQVSLQQFNNRYNMVSGTPEMYIIADNRLTIHPAPDAAVGLKMIYYDTVPDLTADTDTHPLIIANPNIFIYAAMREASPFLQADDRIATWDTLLSEEIGNENAYSEASRWSGSPLHIESGMATP